MEDESQPRSRALDVLGSALGAVLMAGGLLLIAASAASAGIFLYLMAAVSTLDAGAAAITVAGGAIGVVLGVGAYRAGRKEWRLARRPPSAPPRP